MQRNSVAGKAESWGVKSVEEEGKESVSEEDRGVAECVARIAGGEVADTSGFIVESSWMGMRL